VYALNFGIIGTLSHYRKERHLALSPRARWKIEKFFKMLGGSANRESEQPRPKLCPACRTLVGAGATRCHNCGANMRFSMAAASQTLGRYLPQTSPVTYTLLTFSCIAYGISLLATMRHGGFSAMGGGLFNFGGIDDQVLLRMGASLRWAVDQVEPWRLVTAVFLHASILHILFNMWVLMDIGPQIEELYGSARFLFIYVVTGVGGYFLSSLMGNFSVGGSGALLGLIGVLLAMTMGRRAAGMQMLRQSLIRWLIYIAVLGLLMHGIDNWAHAGGLATGFLLGKILTDRPPSTPQETRLAQALGWIAALAIIGSFALAGLAARGGI
jgi:membrane associated rhomboid family serine protease